jgi:hypothetical protein
MIIQDSRSQDFCLLRRRASSPSSNSQYLEVHPYACAYRKLTPRKALETVHNINNHSSLLSLWNLNIMKDTLRLLLFHLRMLPYAVTIAYPFGNSRGLLHVHPILQTSAGLSRNGYAPPTADKGKPANQDQTPVLTTRYAISNARSGRSGTRTRSTQTCYPDLFTARPSPPGNKETHLFFQR